MRMRMILGVAGGLTLGMIGAASASPLAGGAAAAAMPGARMTEQVQYYYYGPRRYHAAPGYYYNDGYYYRRGWRGDGVAAGVAAGAIGALAIGGLAASGAFDPPAAAMAPPRKQWCMDRFRSYNPVDGTYIDNRGRVRFCG